MAMALFVALVALAGMFAGLLIIVAAFVADPPAAMVGVLLFWWLLRATGLNWSNLKRKWLRKVEAAERQMAA